MKKVTKQLLKGMQFVELWLCLIATIIMIFACSLQVFNRNVTQLPLNWTEELARFAMVWLAMLGSSIGLRRGKQMCVDFFYNKFGASVKKACRIIGDILCAVFCGTMAYYSFLNVQQQFIVNQVSTGLQVPMSFVYSIMPVCFFVMMAFEIYLLVLDIRNIDTVVEITKEKNDTDISEEG